MLITLLIPTSGTARVLGHDVVKDAREVRKRIGYVFGGDRGLYERLSALDNLRYFAELYGVDRASRSARIDELLELVGLEGREKERVEGYSAACAAPPHRARLLHDPTVVFLDEPTIGVDPVGARELRPTIARSSSRQDVLLTTHYMFEADALCDRIAVIAKGEIVAEGTPRELKSRVGRGSVVEIEVYGVPDGRVERCAPSRACAPSRRGARPGAAARRPDRPGAELTSRPARPPRRRERRPRTSHASRRSRTRTWRSSRAQTEDPPSPGLGWLRT
jgi:ABC-2 type transport system ATP-binding protein